MPADDHDRLTEIEPEDADIPEPALPDGVVEVPTDWEPPTDDETEEDQ